MHVVFGRGLRSARGAPVLGPAIRAMLRDEPRYRLLHAVPFARNPGRLRITASSLRLWAAWRRRAELDGSE